jgi:hypothetical protein
METNSSQSAGVSLPVRPAGPSGTRSLTKLLLGFAVSVTMGAALLIAVEQHRQTVANLNNVCYSRAAAAAAIAATEISTNGSSKANPAAKFADCDRVAGFAP